MAYEYKLENFIAKPINGDKRLFIYNKDGELVDSIIVDLSHYFVKNNCLIIKITNKNDLILSFADKSIAQQALEKLDDYRRDLMTANFKLTRSNIITFNTLNRNMRCLDITPGVDNQLVTLSTVAQIPISRIDVIVNGSTHISCGVPDGLDIGCYFTSAEDAGDVTKARINNGDVQLGDQLYWIGSIAGFDPDSTDWIDFDYLI